ncbi:hypothetical protein MKW92_044886, partial [Papaver armeniacum]
METLDLRSIGISKLPSSLSSLVSLRTLYLEHCVFDPSTDISLVGHLKKLVILSLQDCNLERLPHKIVELTGLKSLNLSHNKSLQVPPNVISRLSQLEELYMKESFSGWEIEGWQSEMKASLDELIFLLKKVETLKVKKSNDLKSMAQIVPTHVGFKNMKSLGIEECNGMEFLMRAQEAVAARNTFSALEDLVIRSMDNLNQLFDGPVPTGFIDKLKELTINKCNNMVNIFDSNLFKRAPNLDEIRIEGTQHTILSKHGYTNCTRGRILIDFLLPELIKLELKDLPELTDLHQGSTSLECPCLQHLEVVDCENLNRICLSHQRTPKLEKIVGNDETWFENIEWESPDDKQHMHHLFSGIYSFHIFFF